MFETCTIFSRRSIMILFGLVAFVIGSLGVKVSGRDNPSITSMNRPMRDQRHLVLTVGQSEGDLQGKDDKAYEAFFRSTYRQAWFPAGYYALAVGPASSWERRHRRTIAAALRTDRRSPESAESPALPPRRRQPSN